jgi:hypothetical protein
MQGAMPFQRGLLMEFDFPLKVDRIDDVPEAFRGMYMTEEGKDGASMNEVLAKRISDLGGLTTSLQAERKAKTQLEKAVRRWETLGATPDEVAAKIKSWEEFGETPDAIRHTISEKDRLIHEKGDIGKQIEQMRGAHSNELNKVKDSHKKELETAQGEARKFRKAMEQEKIDSALLTEITRQRGIAKLILPIAQHHIRVVEDNGKFEPRVIDRDGDVRVNGKGEPMSVADLISEMKNDAEIAYAFDAEGRAGSGTTPGTTTRRGVSGAQTYTLSQWQSKVATATTAERTRLLQQKAANQIVVTNP